MRAGRTFQVRYTMPPAPPVVVDYPQELRQTFCADRRLLNRWLSVAVDAIRQVVAEFYPGIQVGLIYTGHNFGRDLGFKPHVHVMITKGGLRYGLG